MISLKTSSQCMVVCGLLFEIVATLWTVALSVRAGIFQFEDYDDCSSPEVYSPFLLELQAQSSQPKYFAYSLEEVESLSLISRYETFNVSTSPEFSIEGTPGFAKFKKRCTCNNLDSAPDVLVTSYYDTSFQYFLKSCSDTEQNCGPPDVQNYCGGDSLGDGICDHLYNTKTCNYDEGDCCNSSPGSECLDPYAEENIPSSLSDYTRVDDKFTYSPPDDCWFLIPNGIAIVITVSIASSLLIEIFECYFEYIHIVNKKDFSRRIKIFILFLEVASVIAVGSATISMDDFKTYGGLLGHSYHSFSMHVLVYASFIFGFVGFVFQTLFICGKSPKFLDSKYLDPIGNGMIWFSSGCLEAVITLFSKWRSENSDRFSVISSEVFSFVALEILAVCSVTVGRIIWIKIKNRKVQNNEVDLDIEKAVPEEPEKELEGSSVSTVVEDFEEDIEKVNNPNIIRESSRKTPEILDYPIRKNFTGFSKVFEGNIEKEVIGNNPMVEKTPE